MLPLLYWPQLAWDCCDWDAIRSDSERFLGYLDLWGQKIKRRSRTLSCVPADILVHTKYLLRMYVCRLYM